MIVIFNQLMISCSFCSDPYHVHVYCTCTIVNIASTLRRGTLSPSGEIIARISLVMIGGAPGSADGAVPNSNLKTVTQKKSWVLLTAPLPNYTPTPL